MNPLLLSRFLEFIKTNHLFEKEEKILLAVSGGRDSVAMAHLFHRAGIPFGMGHCNFQLRGDASEEDAIFCRELGKSMEAPFFTIDFNTEAFAKKNKYSIQEAARWLRYDWLEQIRQEGGFHYIATAHHLNDSIETLLYNLIKGCGISGLHGILPKRKKLIRPLLFATREDIDNFIDTESLPFREDASNLSLKYARNKIRHQIMPFFMDINPAFIKTTSYTLQYLKDTEAIFDYAISEFKKEIQTVRSDKVFVDSKKLEELPGAKTILYEIVKKFGFSGKQTDQIYRAINKTESKQFFSNDYELRVGRVQIIIKKKSLSEEDFFTIEESQTKVDLGHQLLHIIHLKSVPEDLRTGRTTALLDLDRLEFPLILRHWKDGDHFQPFGMQGKRQKLQDYFTNQKLSIHEKEEVWLLESGGKICWVVGFRADERFKVGPKTRRVLKLSLDQPG